MIIFTDKSKGLCNEGKHDLQIFFLEIINNGPFLIQQQKMWESKKMVQYGGVILISISSATVAKSATDYLSQGI